MLYPRVQAVSSKGQMILTADIRRAFPVGKFVMVIPNTAKGEIVVKPLVGKDPIEFGYGMISGGKSLAQIFLEEKTAEKRREKKKYAKLHL